MKIGKAVTPAPPPIARTDRRVLGRPGMLAAALAGLAVLVALIILSLAVGSQPLSPIQVWSSIWGDDGSPAAIIVRQMRAPRTLLAILIGSALGLAGVLMQAMTRNPLAEPGVLGVNAGAAVAVVLGIALLGVTGIAGYVWFALAGAAGAAVAVFLLGRRGGGRQGGGTHLLLAGIALTACLGACTGIVTMFDSDTFDSYRFWVVGSLENRDLGLVATVAPFLLVGLALAVVLAPALNALLLGEDTATSLGVPIRWVRTSGFVAVTLLCGAATAAAGPIAFVGLVVPHTVRLMVGNDQRRVVLGSLLFGPILLLAADIIGRVIARPDELEVGIVTAFIGAPVLLALVLRIGASPRRSAIGSGRPG